MKKTLIASAVALATLASASAGAQELTLPKVYGNVQLVLQQVDIDAGDVSRSQFDLGDTGSTIGFEHEHEVRPGLTAFAKAEFEFNADDLKNGGLDEGDQAFVGLKGDFGLVKVGSFDTIYDDAITDNVYDLFEDLGEAYQAAKTGEGDTIAYYSPSFNGLQFAAAVQVHGGGDVPAFEMDDDGDIAPGPASPAENHSYMAVASYQLGDTSFSLAWDSAAGAEDVFGLAAVHKMGDIRLGASFEIQDDAGELIGLSGVLTQGANQFIGALQYLMPDGDGAENSPILTLQALHNMSSNFYVYVEGEWADNYQGIDGADYSALTLGATYVF